MIDPNVVVKNAEAADGYITELLNKINRLEKQLKNSEKDVRFLNCLRTCGVDNWEGYGEAQKMMWENDNEV